MKTTIENILVKVFDRRSKSLGPKLGSKAWVQRLSEKLGSKTLFNDDDHAHGCVRVHDHGHDDGDVQHEL